VLHKQVVGTTVNFTKIEDREEDLGGECIFFFLGFYMIKQSIKLLKSYPLVALHEEVGTKSNSNLNQNG